MLPGLPERFSLPLRRSPRTSDLARAEFARQYPALFPDGANPPAVTPPRPAARRKQAVEAWTRTISEQTNHSSARHDAIRATASWASQDRAAVEPALRFIALDPLEHSSFRIGAATLLSEGVGAFEGMMAVVRDLHAPVPLRVLLCKRLLSENPCSPEVEELVGRWHDAPVFRQQLIGELAKFPSSTALLIRVAREPREARRRFAERGEAIRGLAIHPGGFETLSFLLGHDGDHRLRFQAAESLLKLEGGAAVVQAAVRGKHPQAEDLKVILERASR